MIIFRDLMMQLGLSENFKHQVLQCDGVIVPMKEPIDLKGKRDIPSRKMCEGVIQIAEPVSTREAPKRSVKTLGSNYSKVDIEQVVANSTQMSAEERTQLLRLPNNFKDLFYGSLGLSW